MVWVFLIGYWLPSLIRPGFFIRKKNETLKGDTLWSHETQMGEVPGEVVLTRESRRPDSSYIHYSFRFRPFRWWHRLKESKGRLATISYQPGSQKPSLSYSSPISWSRKLKSILKSAAAAVALDIEQSMKGR